MGLPNWRFWSYFKPSPTDIPFYVLKTRQSWFWDNKDYALEVRAEFANIFSESDLNWLRESWNKREFQELVELHISLVEKLDHEPVGPTRTALVEKISNLSKKEFRKMK